MKKYMGASLILRKVWGLNKFELCWVNLLPQFCG